MPPALPKPAAERKLVAPIIRREATVRPATFDETDRSVEVMMSTGAAVLRFDWYDGEYYDETLGLDAGEVRLDRINSYAPLLDAHNSFSLSDVIGSVVPGTVRVENGELIGRVRFSSTPDVADIVTKVREGDIQKVSIGYQVYAFESRDPGDGKREEMRAVDWEPVEVSFVPIPAEFAAGVRGGLPGQSTARSQANPAGGYPCIIRGAAATPKESEMDNPSPTPAPTPTPAPSIDPSPSPAPAVEPTPSPERAATPVTIKRIREVCGRDLGDKIAADLIERHIDKPMTEAELNAALVEEYAKKSRSAPPINNAITISADEKDKYRAALTGALLVRMTDADEKPKDGGEVFGHMTVREMARDYLSRAGVKNHVAMGPFELVSSALGMQRHGAQTSSDFALALQQAGNLAIIDSYELAVDDGWRQLSKKKNANDFRPNPVTGLTGTPEFLVVDENGEYTYASFRDIGDSYKLWTAGRIISLSRQLIIDDQLGLFGDMAGHLGRGAALHEANAWWANLLGNPALADGIALFHASHGNLAATGTALSVASLSAGRTAMRVQKDRDGVTPLNVVPKFLVIGPNNETIADQLLSAILANQVANVVPGFIRSLTVIVEPRITDYSWYLVADPARTPALQHAYLRGQEGIFTDTRVGFEVDGVEYKGRIDFNAKAAGFQGVYKNPGAAPA